MKILMRSLQLSIMAFLVLLVTSFAIGHQIGDKVTCLKAKSPPTIDGKLDEWYPETSISGGWLTPDSDNVSPYQNDPMPEDAEDCTFNLYAMWDESNFYVALGVVDDSVEIENPDPKPWNAPDYCELYMDPTNRSDAGRSLSWCIANINGKKKIALQADPVEREALDYDMALNASETVKNDQSGWILELRLGKESFDPDPITLEPTQIMGCMFILNDTDGGNGSRIAFPVGADWDALATEDYFKLVLSEETAAVSPKDNSAITWGKVKTKY